MKEFLKKHWPPVALFFVVFLLFVTNYRLGTYLTGWDNLHPEFSFGMNIQRSLFAVWQEYQGLGLLGGMGHAADLVRQLFLLILSLIIPNSLLRYIWTFLMLFVGSTGAYYLIKFLNHPEKQNDQQIPDTKYLILDTNLIPFLGGLFYLLNLSTMQTFYAPFEAFVAHFGVLPWFLLASLSYVTTGTKKSLLFLFLVLFLSTPQAYIPTLFVVCMLALSIMVLVHLFFAYQAKTFFQTLLQTTKLYIIIFLINAFWLLPFAYFTVTNVSVTLNAKINQMATEAIFAQNKEFGDFADVALLKGFWFNNIDPNRAGQFDVMLRVWRDHLSSPFVILIGYILFSIVAIGAVHAIRARKHFLWPAVFLFFFAVTMLTTATPPFSWINQLIRDHFTILNQAFRFPFTKFSILTSLTFAIFFAVGSRVVLDSVLKKYRWQKMHLAAPAVLILLLVIITFPMFSGNLIYEKERLVVPPDYFKTYAYFAKEDKDARIANFPQHTFWGWEFYQWGYGGSGFLWYGIHQPILDRAFDVWSKADENYYAEISQALYAKDKTAFENVLQKYQVRFLLVDKSVYNPVAPTTTFLPELDAMIKSSTSIKKDATFGNISIYKVHLLDNPKSFIFASQNLPTSNSYAWGENDQMYQASGTYLSEENTQQQQVTYPFRTLYSNKTENEKPFSLKEKKTTLILSSPFTLPASPSVLHIPSYATTEQIVPVEIVAKSTTSDAVQINLLIHTPTLFLDGKKIWGKTVEQPIFTAPKKSLPMTMNINGVANFKIFGASSSIGTSFLTLQEDNSIVFSDLQQKVLQTIAIPAKGLATLPLFQEQTLTLSNTNEKPTLTAEFPKINDGYLSFAAVPKETDPVQNCNFFAGENPGTITQKAYQEIGKTFIAFSAFNATACITYFAENLPHHQGYALFVDSQNKKGRGFHFWVLNEDEKYAPIDMYLPTNKRAATIPLILPPQETFGRSYSLHLENIAIGSDVTENALGRIAVFPLPYNFLTTLMTSDNQQAKNAEPTQSVTNVTHPNESVYIVELADVPQDTTLVLSQAYDNGWKAYALNPQTTPNSLEQVFPFFFGTELPNHVLVNNWENGWKIPSDSTLNPNRFTLVIIYLPQYLEYLGFLLLFCVFLYSLVVLTKILRSKS